MMVELLISIMIMSVMSTIVLSANSNMSARLQADNLAHMIALSIREAQTRALSATVPVNANGAGEVPGYGVYINRSNGTQVTTFTDTADEAAYSAETSDVYTNSSLGQGFTISQLRGRDEVTGYDMPTEGISIFFKRPRPDAVLNYLPTAGPMRAANAVTIEVSSAKAGVTKTITVTSTGQISVQ